MDNIKQVVKDVRFLIATNCCDETIQARIENFINEREQALRQSPVSGSLPLDKLRKKLDEALTKETPETLIKWLDEKRK